MRIRVFFHDRCFDGAASAALFSRVYRERVRADAQFFFTGLVHRAGALFDERLFDAPENAIVDFKYSASARVTWWFDHHQSAFLTPDDQEHYRKNRDPRRFFFDPNYKSCTKLIADVAGREFGFDAAPVAELVRWADIIDGAQYPDARSAVEMKDAAPRLTMIIEASQDDSLMPRLIPLLAGRPLAEILDQPFVAPLLQPLLARHEKSIDILRQRAECRDGTVFFDVIDQELEGYNKFVPYYLHPDCAYSVGLSKSSFRTKVSVGSNPWSPRSENMVNLAAICERYGGGGHARVGAISFAPDQLEQARAAAREIVAELRAGGSS
ncbi:MAG: phosphoesterase [Acidobacteria bacterium]|nr:phosphoesterase [Acidobacteriota bacterium]